MNQVEHWFSPFHTCLGQGWFILGEYSDQGISDSTFVKIISQNEDKFSWSTGARGQGHPLSI
jgi:hypothetical protein